LRGYSFNSFNRIVSGTDRVSWPLSGFIYSTQSRSKSKYLTDIAQINLKIKGF
jgi:hypothetical protein